MFAFSYLLFAYAAIVSGGKGTAQDKIKTLKEAGVTVVESPAKIGAAIYDVFRQRGLVWASMSLLSNCSAEIQIKNVRSPGNTCKLIDNKDGHICNYIEFIWPAEKLQKYLFIKCWPFVTYGFELWFIYGFWSHFGPSPKFLLPRLF